MDPSPLYYFLTEVEEKLFPAHLSKESPLSQKSVLKTKQLCNLVIGSFVFNYSR